MKQLTLILAIVLSSFVAMAQSKPDTSKSHYLHVDSVRKAWIFSTNSFPEFYTVDWSKIKTFNDLKTVMQAFNFYISADTKNFKKIRKYLILKK